MFCSRCGTQVDTSTRFCPNCGQDLSALTNAGKTTPLSAQPPQENETDIVREALKDEYELEKELGRGGMAVVYKARDKQLDREVAIKVLPFSLSFDAEFVERFQREARTAGKLEHPNIIPIYRVGRSGRVIFFVMKFIRGKSLSAAIEAKGAMPVKEIKRFLAEATSALGYAHKHGIVHRDIKPDNIMFDELGQAIVADFGIAKAQSGAKLTGTGMSIGTPHYMSPEQARAQNLDGRSDIYSLGVVAYQALTGHVPFDGEDSFSIGYKHIMEELPVPALEAADQRAMFQVVQKMMAKKPDDRYQSADELIAALETTGQHGPSAMDMANMRTLAMEPMKPVAPPPPRSAPPAAAVGATAPLPRASASMGKPKDAQDAQDAPDARTKASPERASAPARPSFKPKETTAKKSNALPYGIAAALVLVGGGLGGYLYWNKQQTEARRRDVVAESTRIELARLETMRLAALDTSKAAGTTPHDTAKAAGTSKSESGTSRTPSGTSRTPSGTSRTPVNTATSRTPVNTPPVTNNAANTTPAGPMGTISLNGTIPPNARVTIDGRQQTGSRIKVSAGTHTLEIVAQGYRTFSMPVTVAANATQSVPVALVAAAPGTTPPVTTPPTNTNAAVPAACQTPAGSSRNNRHECYDTRPIALTVTQAQAPSSCTGMVATVNLMVQVDDEGNVVGEPTVQRSSNCRAFNETAKVQVQEIRFTPARKAGRPVNAWIIVPMTAAPRQ